MVTLDPASSVRMGSAHIFTTVLSTVSAIKKVLNQYSDERKTGKKEGREVEGRGGHRRRGESSESRLRVPTMKVNVQHVHWIF